MSMFEPTGNTAPSISNKGSEKPQKKRRWPYLLVGGIMMADTIFARTVSTANLGVIAPFILGVPLVIFGLTRRSAFWRRRFPLMITRLAAFCYALLFLLLAAMSVYCAGIKKAPVKAGADAIIVLGAAVHNDVPSATLTYRVERAAQYAADNPGALIVVTGGQGSYENRSEASVMREMLVSMGIDGERIVEEDAAKNTLENLVLSKAILDERLGEKISVAIVTDAHHTFRARLIARKIGFDEVTCLPSRSVECLVPNFYLRELASIAKALLTGSI